jgi:hypothetical protein
MPENSCNPENVMGKLAGVFDAGGIETTDSAYQLMTDNAKLLFQQVVNKQQADILNAAKPKAPDIIDDTLDETTHLLGQANRVNVKSVVTASMKPTDLFPEDVTKPILSAVDDFYIQHANDLRGKAGQFKASIKSVINSLDESKIPEWAKGEWEHWKRDLQDGHPFYEKKGGIVSTILNNTVSNSINLSNNVVSGNVFELMIKAPTLYGFRPSLVGAIETLGKTKGNIWARIPELDERGFYGFPLEPSKNFLKIPLTGKLNDLSKKTTELIMNTTQRPLVNIAYGVGKAKTGTHEGGIEALEKIAFSNRLGNRPRLFRNQADAASLKLMNYTFSQYQMMGGLLAGLTKKETAFNSARGLATWLGLQSAIGGVPSLMPRGMSDILAAASPEYKEWEKENMTPIGKLVQPGNITVGAAQSIWNRVVETAQKDAQSGAEKLANDDPTGAARDLTMAGLTMSIGFGQNIMTNPRVQKTIRGYFDLNDGDIDNQELNTKLTKIWAPFLSKEE